MDPEQKPEEEKKVEEPQEQEINAEKKGNSYAKKADMISEMMKASKEKDTRKMKYYQQLLKKHSFWDKQPTLRDDEEQTVFGNIQGVRKVEQVQKIPLQLSENLYWCEINISDEKQLSELYTLLTNHYVEDDDNTFRFDYSREFLRWALTPPTYQPKWTIGIRDKTLDHQLVSSITGVPVHVSVEQDNLKMAQINFLCVHKKYRSQNLAAKLIAEVTRRVNLKNKWQAIYTSGTVLPTPFTQAVYYHRSLNPKKLIDIGFSGLGRNQTMAMVQKLYKLADEPDIPGLRPLTKKDVPGATKLINQGLSKFKVKFVYTQEEIKHYFSTRQNVVYAYVVQKPNTDKKKPQITDFLSFYMLPSHVMKHPKHDMLYACYSFMNFATSVPLKDLIRNALILAKSLKCDVYNCLNLMDNATVFDDLYFQKGDGHLNYYFYNWIMKQKHIQSAQLGVVLF